MRITEPTVNSTLQYTHYFGGVEHNVNSRVIGDLNLLAALKKADVIYE